MNIDELFDGPLVTTVPSLIQLNSDKAPGDGDGEDKGDHCKVSL
jgi:hypothetical protein